MHRSYIQMLAIQPAMSIQHVMMPVTQHVIRLATQLATLLATLPAIQPVSVEVHTDETGH